MLSINDINVLGSLIDVTFGRQSSQSGSTAVRTKLVGEKLLITYHEVVNIAKDQDKHQQLEPVRDRAKKCVKEHLKFVEKEFSKAAKKKLSTKFLTDNAELEALGYNFNSPALRSLYRFTSTYTVE